MELQFRCHCIAARWVPEFNLCFSQLMLSSEKKSIPGPKILLVVRPVLDLPPGFANGCICGGILGANATTVSSASTLSLTLELCCDVWT